MSHYPGVETAHRFFSGTGSTYDCIANLCTFGFDLWWKRRILREIPTNPKCILDQACGTGILSFKLAQQFPRCRVIGVELRGEYLDRAKQKAKALNVPNVQFIIGRAEEVLLKDQFDCITSSYLAKYADLRMLVQNAKQMLREGGILIVHDFAYPKSRLFLRLWKFYFKILQKIGAWAFPEWQTAFHELPALLQSTRWVHELVLYLKENGFSRIRQECLFMNTSALVVATNQRGFPRARK